MIEHADSLLSMKAFVVLREGSERRTYFRSYIAIKMTAKNRTCHSEELYAVKRCGNLYTRINDEIAMDASRPRNDKKNKIIVLADDKE